MDTSDGASLEEALNLAGKVAIVTGASRGIGRGIAQRLAEQGAQVMLTARNAILLTKSVEEMHDAGLRAECISVDLRDADAATQIVERTVATFGGVDIVVNNAGATKRGDFFQLTDEDWEDGFALKFMGAMRLTRATWPHLKKNGGSVLYIAGAGGRTPGADFTIGGSVNAALLSFTKAMAEAGLRDGVQVNAVNPGLVRTDRLLARLQEMTKTKGIDLAAAEQAIVAATKSSRIGLPEDIANLVAFIVSPAGRFLQGSLIDIDGGPTKTM
jgi:NAD(P)-dependent dehydrogenase (short-subunit alcohol dehydrogenase family)